ncbi:hypothetical protein [Yoonia sp. MH D7]
MWFDVQQALAEIEGGTPPPSVQLPVQDPAPTPAPRVAVVAGVATPLAQKRQIAADPDAQHPHGTTLDGQPLTWTGRVVSLASWRMLTEWDRHGPKGKHWNGVTKQWDHPKGN